MLRYEIYDGHNLLNNKAIPLQFLIEGVLPLGTCGDLAGPPGDGKSTLLLHLALSISSEQGDWFGRRIANGKVVILGGEKSCSEAWGRDLHRVWKGKELPDAGDFTIINCPSLYKWDKKHDIWTPTGEYDKAMDDLNKIQPVLVIVDTIGRAAIGQNTIDYAQQAELAIAIESIRDRLNTTLLTVSHTNQSSVKEKLNWRLHWLSRNGGSGLPGVFRWVGGVTRLFPADLDYIDDYAAIEAGLDFESVSSSKILAFGVSKYNEMPTPFWNNNQPALFEITEDGQIYKIAEKIHILYKKKKKRKEKEGVSVDYHEEEEIEIDEVEERREVIKKRTGRPRTKWMKEQEAQNELY